jgi:hypothetical protein
MNVVTHALLPALLATPLLRHTERRGFYREAGIVALGGALPDLVNPHLSLAARYASWSHTIYFLLGFGILLVLLSRLAPERLPTRLALLAWLAAGLHLFGDAASGGIALFQPLSPIIVRTQPRWVPYHAWLWCDAACVLAALVVMIVLGRRFDRQGVGREATS